MRDERGPALDRRSRRARRRGVHAVVEEGVLGAVAGDLEGAGVGCRESLARGCVDSSGEVEAAADGCLRRAVAIARTRGSRVGSSRIKPMPKGGH